MDTTEQLSPSLLMLCDHHHSGLRTSSSAQEEIWSPSGSRSPPLHPNPGNQSLLCLYGFAYSGYFIYHFKVFFFFVLSKLLFYKKNGLLLSHNNLLQTKEVLLSNGEIRRQMGALTPRRGPAPHRLPLPALALVWPRPILTVGFLHEGLGVLGLGGPPGETLLQLILRGQAGGFYQGKCSEPGPVDKPVYQSIQPINHAASPPAQTHPAPYSALRDGSKCPR